MWDPAFDNASRLVALHCYALQTGMGEVERVKIEQDILGESCGVDCPLHYEDKPNGTLIEVDGWLMPVLEVKRIQAAREEIATSDQSYFSQDSYLLPSDLRYASFH